MLFKLCLSALLAVACAQVAEKGSVDDLISDVFGNGGEGSRTDIVNEKVRSVLIESSDPNQTTFSVFPVSRAMEARESACPTISA